MELTDKVLNRQILGCLMKNPLLLVDNEIVCEDFGTNRIARVIFISIQNLYKTGTRTITPLEVDQDVQWYEGSYVIYKQERGLEVVKESYEIAKEENFKTYFTKFKKLTLLRELKKKGYDISPYYKEDYESVREENETVERFDKASVEDILDYVEGKFNKIKRDFLNGKKEDSQAAKGIDKLIDSLLEQPEVGVELCGNMFNTAMSGARLGKYYLRSSSSGSGKSRTLVFDACKICFPSYWSHEKQAFVRECVEEGKAREPRKTLIITTELAKDEVKTMILAYLSGVNESHILKGNYWEGELERVRFAAKIMNKYKDYLFIDEISDPNLMNVSSSIKKYATLEKVKFVFYDYLFTSPSLLDQFSDSKIREDVALTMLSTQLKDLAKDYNLFISSATQVNAEAMNGDGFKNETCIRGSKGIVDKCDTGCIVVKVEEKEKNFLNLNLKEAGRPPLPYEPTHRFDIYKNRRGQYKNISIWSYINLGTGERHDLYITTMSGKIIKEFEVSSSTYWEEEIKFG